MLRKTPEDKDWRAPEEKRFLCEAELARRWRVSPRTLQRWRRSGRGPAHLKFGNRVRYPLEEVELYEARHRQGGQEE